MAYLMRRMYCSKKQRTLLWITAMIFILYHAIFQFGTEVTMVTIDSLDIKHRYRNIPTEIENYVSGELPINENKGTECDMPKIDLFSEEIMKFDQNMIKIVCKRKDWVKCYLSKCTVVPELLKSVGDNIECTYMDILYQSDDNYTFGSPEVLKGNQNYTLNKSDHLKISCNLSSRAKTEFTSEKSWIGLGVAYRPIQPEKPPPGRENTLNVLIFGFDSAAKNGIISKMPKSYMYIKEQLGAVVMNKYNIVGDGTPAALFPLLTGKTELELPEWRKSIPNSGYVDHTSFIFYKLKKDGYRTAYYEDSPKIGTFQERFNGFRHQPADHYLRDFYIEEENISSKAKWATYPYLPNYCVGGVPRYKLMMNITDQFFKLGGKRFAFTFVADISHGVINMLTNADDAFVEFLDGFKRQGRFKDTLLIVMGDHGPRYGNARMTLQSSLEERLPFMAILLPDDLTAKRPDALNNLRQNMDTLTTVHDIHATILDVVDMREHWNNFKIKGANLTRGMTLLKPIPTTRSCSEAGIEPYWCVCLRWETVTPEDPLYNRTAQALVDHINDITEFQRSECAIRTLISIDWVTKEITSKEILEFHGAAKKLDKQIYQVKITVGPGTGTYEGAVTHLIKENKFQISTREISRTNAYNKEPECISDVYPHLNMYCYCNK